MHRIWIVILLLTISLPAPLWAAGNQGRAEVAFSEGLLAYHEGNYSEAEISFTKAVRLDPQHTLAAHFLGMSYFKQERYEQAARAFKGATLRDVSEPEPYFYRGVSLYRIELTQNALPEFQRAYDLAAEGPLKDLAQSYIRRITGEEEISTGGKRRPWFFYARFGTQFDSNVSLNPENITISTLPSDQNDIQFFLQAGGGSHLIRKKQYRLTWEARYSQNLYPDLNQFNYGVAHAEIRNQLAFGNFYLNIPAIYEFALLGSSKYLHTPQLHPSISYLAAKHFLSRLTARGRYNAFFQDLSNQAQDRDAWNLQGEFAEYVYFSGKKRYFKVFYIFEQNLADGADWDFRAHTVGGAFYSPVIWEIAVYLYGAYTIDKSFKNVDSVIGTKRDDSHHYYSIRFSRPIYDGLSLTLHYAFRRNSSNQAFFQYNKHNAGVTFEYRI